MEKTILNVDSRDVVTNNPAANNATFWDFEPFIRTTTKTTLLPLTLANNNNPNLFNAQQTQQETVRTGFRQIKNVKRITISNIKWFYTTGAGGAATLSNVTTNLGMYRLMRINDLGNVEANDGSKYTTKLDLYFDQNESYLIPTISTIEFDKPTDLKKLRIRFYHPNNGNPIAPVTKGTPGVNNNGALFFDTVPAPGGVAGAVTGDDAGGAQQTTVNNLLYRFSFTLEVESIPNSISKSYEEMFNYSDELLKRMAYTKMIEYYDRENKKDEKSGSVDNLAAQMNHTMTNIHNQQEFQHDGQRINYGFNGFPNNK